MDALDKLFDSEKSVKISKNNDFIDIFFSGMPADQDLEPISRLVSYGAQYSVTCTSRFKSINCEALYQDILDICDALAEVYTGLGFKVTKQ